MTFLALRRRDQSQHKFTQCSLGRLRLIWISPVLAEDGVILKLGEGLVGVPGSRWRYGLPQWQVGIIRVDQLVYHRVISSTFLAALCPGIPLTAPPRLAEEPHSKMLACSVSTPHWPTSSSRSVNGQVRSP